MSFQFNYSSTENPSVPLVPVTVETYFGKKEDAIGKIDTGAAITIIPEKFLEKLEMKKSGTTIVGGPFSNPQLRDTYEIYLIINNIKFDLMSVIAAPRLNVLLGRDLLNILNMEFDSRNKTGKASHWSINPADAT